MGIYVITGGTKGIGLAAIVYLKKLGHEVFNIDITGGDVDADLGTREGRRYAVDTVIKSFPDGIDGLILNAGIVLHPMPSRVISVNYFGVITLAEGLFDLLKKRNGNCVVTTSGSLAYADKVKWLVDTLLVNCGDEERINRLVDSFPPEKIGFSIYHSTKLALVRWLRRTAPAWAARGVNLNAVAPGAIDTTIMPPIEDETAAKEHFENNIMSRPIPIVYAERTMIAPEKIGAVLAMMVMPEAKGMCGEVVYCDGGTSAVLHNEKTY